MLRDGVVVEGVERLAQLPEDVVRHVHEVVDGAQAHRAQPLGEPRGRGLDRETGDDARGVARAEVGVENLDRRERCGVGLPFLDRDLREAEGRARERRDFARDADDAERVGAVRRDLDLEDRVVGPRYGERGAERRGGQLDDSEASWPMPSSSSEQSIPSETVPRILAALIARPPGMLALAGKVAPGGAKAVRRPGAALGAPQITENFLSGSATR